MIETQPLEFGIESTIISLLKDKPVLLRPGPITTEKLREIIPELTIDEDMSQAIAPGMKYRHYSPKAQVSLIPWQGDKEKITERGIKMYQELLQVYTPSTLALICTEETKKAYVKWGINCISLGSRADLYRVASNLFHALRQLDEDKIACALIEGFEEKGLGITIMNRLKKTILK